MKACKDCMWCYIKQDGTKNCRNPFVLSTEGAGEILDFYTGKIKYAQVSIEEARRGFSNRKAPACGKEAKYFQNK